MDAGGVRKILRDTLEAKLGDGAGAAKIDVLCVDLSGNAEPGRIIQVMESYDRVFKPRLVIIKNFKLENFVRQVRPGTGTGTCVRCGAVQGRASCLSCKSARGRVPLCL